MSAGTKARKDTEELFDVVSGFEVLADEEKSRPGNSENLTVYGDGESGTGVSTVARYN